MQVSKTSKHIVLACVVDCQCIIVIYLYIFLPPPVNTPQFFEAQFKRSNFCSPQE